MTWLMRSTAEEKQVALANRGMNTSRNNVS